MKHLALALLLIPLGCSRVGSSAGDQAFGELDRELIDVVAFDTGCPASHIEILDRPGEQGPPTFAVEACGREIEYRRTDQVFHSTDSRF